MSTQAFNVEEKILQPTTVAGIRMRGKYSDCGKAFGKLFRALGRLAGGPPMMLHYDGCYKAEDADFEPCVPVRHAHPVDGVDVHELPGGRCISLIHLGPYDELGRSYEKVNQYLKDNGLCASVPSRELYLKGPGMIFKGNPRKYRTEIQMMVTPAPAAQGAPSATSAAPTA